MNVAGGPGPAPGPLPPPPAPPSGDPCCACILKDPDPADDCLLTCAKPESQGLGCEICITFGGGRSCLPPCNCMGPFPGRPHNQQWYGPDSNSKQTILFHDNTKKCLDLPNDDTTNGNHIQIW